MGDLLELRDRLMSQIMERQELIGPRSLSPSDSAWLSATYGVVMEIDHMVATIFDEEYIDE